MRVGANDGHNHDSEFGTKIYAVDTRARCLLGLEAFARSEYRPCYNIANLNFRQGRCEWAGVQYPQTQIVVVRSLLMLSFACSS